MRICIFIGLFTFTFSVSADKKALCHDYLPQFRGSLTTPLVQKGTDGVPEVIQLMDDYDLVRDDVDNIMEVTQWPGMKDPMSKVETKVTITGNSNSLRQ